MIRKLRGMGVVRVVGRHRWEMDLEVTEMHWNIEVVDH